MFLQNFSSPFDKRAPIYPKVRNVENLIAVYDTYAAAIYGLLLGWTKNETSAQVILQQTFEAYADYISHNNNDKPFLCLMRIARKKCESLSGAKTMKHDILVKNPSAVNDISIISER